MNTYIMVYELKPENVGDYIDMHENCHKTEFADQLDAIKNSGCEQMMTFIYDNLSILFVQTELDIDDMFAKLGEFPANAKWQKTTAPWFAATPSFDGSAKSEPIRKIFDLKQQLNGELKKF